MRKSTLRIAARAGEEGLSPAWDMPAVIESSVFAEWFSTLKDRTIRARFAVRIDRLAAGNPGDHKGVGDG